MFLVRVMCLILISHQIFLIYFLVSLYITNFPFEEILPQNFQSDFFLNLKPKDWKEFLYPKHF